MAIFRASTFMVAWSAYGTRPKNSTAEPIGLMTGSSALNPRGINLRTRESSFTVVPQVSCSEALYEKSLRCASRKMIVPDCHQTLSQVPYRVTIGNGGVAERLKA